MDEVDEVDGVDTDTDEARMRWTDNADEVNG